MLPERLRKRWARPALPNLTEPEFVYFALVSYIRQYYRHDQRWPRVFIAILGGLVVGLSGHGAELSFTPDGVLFFLILVGFGLLLLLAALVGMTLTSTMEVGQTGERHVRRVARLLALCPADVLQAMQRQPETDRAGIAQAGQLLLNASWVLVVAVLGGVLAFRVSPLNPLVLFLGFIVFVIYLNFAEATEISNAATVINQAIHAVEIKRLTGDGTNGGATDGAKKGTVT